MSATDAEIRALSDEEVVAGALQWVNTMREEHNLPALDALPQAVHGHPGDCSIARALSGASDDSCTVPWSDRYHEAEGPSAARWSYALGGRVVERTAPAVVAEFILRFDAGHLDHLLRA